MCDWDEVFPDETSIFYVIYAADKQVCVWHLFLAWTLRGPPSYELPGMSNIAHI
jgi:hypothetical protein